MIMRDNNIKKDYVIKDLLNSIKELKKKNK